MTGGLLAWEGGAYPSLNLKAYNGRLFVMFFEIVLRRLVSDESLQIDDMLRKELELASGATTALAMFFHVMECSGRYLKEEQAASMEQACCTYLDLSNILALHSIKRLTPRWKAVPKHHFFKHMSENMVQCLYNCRYYQSYFDEDFIGRWKLLCQKVPKGLMELRLLTRYLLRLKASRC